MSQEKNKISIFWISILVFISFIWGTQQPVMKVLLEDVSPIFLTFARFFIASLILTPWIIYKKLKVPPKDLISLGFLGIIVIFFYGLLASYGIKHSTASNASLIIPTFPIFAMILVYFLGKERVTLLKAAGALICFLGLLIALMEKGFDFSYEKYGLGNLLLVAATVSYAVYAVYIKSFVQKYGTLRATYYSILFGSLALLIYEFLTKEIYVVYQINWQATMWILYLAIFVVIFAWLFWNKAYSKIGVVNTSVFHFFTPLFGILLSVIFLHEPLTFNLIIGFVLVCAGIYMVQRKEKSYG